MGCAVLLVSGSLRSASTNTAVLRTARAMAPPGMECVLFEGLAALPAFNPDDDADQPPAVVELRSRVRGADALLISTPEYTGALPGSLKNLLEWLIGDQDARSLYRKPVAWINASPRGASDAHDSLRKVLTYAHATILEDVSAEIPVAGSGIGADGKVHDEGGRAEIGGVMRRLRDSLGCGTRE